MKRIIKATANQSKRTFTIRCYYPDGTILKYRTSSMTREEFESCEYNTAQDWNNFLWSSYDYYRVK